eukprot:5118207-Amphidinium_carterae.1
MAGGPKSFDRTQVQARWRLRRVLIPNSAGANPIPNFQNNSYSQRTRQHDGIGVIFVFQN